MSEAVIVVYVPAALIKVRIPSSLSRFLLSLPEGAALNDFPENMVPKKVPPSGSSPNPLTISLRFMLKFFMSSFG
jgi:hypothetical protein